jgi:hypothetical protein
MDVSGEVFSFVAPGGDRQHRPTGVMHRCREEERTRGLGDGYGRRGAHEILQMLVWQQVE